MATTSLSQLVKNTKVFLPDPVEGFVGALITSVDAQGEDRSILTLLNDNGQEVRLDVNSKSKDLPALRNPPILEAVDDLTNLSYLNEASVLHTIRTRYAQRQIYTYSGIVLIATNPFAAVTLYGQDIIQAHAGKRKGELEPHLFAIAEDAYRCMIRDKKNQTIIVSGESGAGKTVSAKYIMRYFATVDDPDKPSTKRKIVGKSGMTETEEQILATNPIMEAFGNAKTTRNDNSSRFGKYIEILFDHDQNIVGAKMRTYLLERSRIVFQPDAERNYHIFYQLLAGAPATERKELELKAASSYKYLRGVSSIKGVDEVKEFEQTQKALSTVGITYATQWQIFGILAALLHLGNVEIKAMRNDASLDDDEPNLVLAAKLLGINLAELRKWLVKKQITTRSETIVSNLSQAQACNVRDAIAKHIYSHIFDWLVDTMNSSLSKQSADASTSFIGVLDIYGFEHFQTNSFEQFCINYANEKLQQEFNSHVFKLEQQEYVKEQIDWTFIDFADNQPTIDLIEGKLGILALLDEETRLPSGSDQSWVQKLHNNFGTEKYASVFKKPKFGQSAFTVSHYALDVSYEAAGFLEKNKDTVPDEMLACLNATTNTFLRDAFGIGKGDDALTMQTKDSSKRGNVIRKPTLGSIFKGSLINLMATIDSTNAHYIRCIKPNEAKEAWKFESPMVLSQLRACGVLETIRISCLGYPSRWTYEEFGERYYMLVSSRGWDAKASVVAEAILNKTITEPDKYQKGLTKIFFRAGMLAHLENLRSQRLKDCALTMQKVLRGNLHRKRYIALKAAVLRAQAQWRGVAARKALLAAKKEKCAIALQRLARAYVERSRFQRARQCAIRIQTLVRARAARLAYVQMRKENAAIRIQSLVRSRSARRTYLDQYKKIIVAQSAIRRHAARKELKALKIEAKSVNHFKEVSFKMETKLVQLTQTLQERTRENKALNQQIEALMVELKASHSKHADATSEAQRLREEAKVATTQMVSKADYDELQRAKTEIEIQLEEYANRLRAQDEEVEILSKNLDSLTKQSNFKPNTNGYHGMPLMGTNGSRQLIDPSNNDPQQMGALKLELIHLREQLARMQETQDSPLGPRERPDGQLFLNTNGAHGITESGLAAANAIPKRVGHPFAPQSPQFENGQRSDLFHVQDIAVNGEILDLLESEIDIENDVVDNLIRDLRIAPPSSDLPLPQREVFYPAHIIALITNEMWRNGLLQNSERFLANVMQTVQQHVMSLTGEEAIVPGIFWMSNIHELLSYVCTVETSIMQGNTPFAQEDASDHDRLVPVVRHDLESLEYNIYHTWLKETKKILNKMVAAALIGSQALPGFVTNDTGRFFNRILPGSHAQATHSMDDVLGLLNTVWHALKSFYVEYEVCQQVIIELLRMVGVTSFNDLLMRRNFCSWKRAMQIQYNLTRIEEWCKSIDMPEGNLQLEHLMQATKLLQLKKSTLGDIEIIYDVCWMLTPSQIQKLISQYYTADYENPISPEILKFVASKVDPHDSHDLLLLDAVPLDDAGPFEVPDVRPLEEGIVPYAPLS